jgi:hypothetical protein
MKKLSLIILSIFLFYPIGKSERIIQLSDIANWYIESDIVLIAGVTWIDTVYTNIDTVNITPEYFEICMYGQEKYGLRIDSIIKGNYKKDTITVNTPEFCVKDSYSVRYSGASINFSEFNSGTWYKLKKKDDKIILIKNIIPDRYEVLYSMQKNSYNLSFLDSVKLYGSNIMLHLPGIDYME